jgi:pyruvate formate lyase activating enzyme
VQEALYYTKKEGNKVKCLLCPWLCNLNPGQTGVCKVRTNNQGKLKTLVYGKVAALGIDPIEKKPLFHFYPGKTILSIGLVGCNLHCTFCQNHTISQCKADTYNGFIPFSSGQLLAKATGIRNNVGIAYTYNEPFTFYEFMFETARLVHSAGMKNVVVSNGTSTGSPSRISCPLSMQLILTLNLSMANFTSNKQKARLNRYWRPFVPYQKAAHTLNSPTLLFQV